MTTNQMRREAAKRKLERQQERRAQQTRRRRRVAAITSAVVVVVVLVGVVLVSTFTGGSDDDPAVPTGDAAPTTESTALAAGECAFVPTPDQPAARPVEVPTITTAPTSGTAAVVLQTDQGPIPLTLDREQGPCAVESFLGLTAAGYYDDTPCHRITTGASLQVLQCGDPTGTGSGGPGYTFNDEPPTALVADPSGAGATYPRGTVAMAKTAAPDSGGSQFFLVYADSVLPPEYTVFGTIDEEGLGTLDAVAAAGSDDSNGPGDGSPLTPTTIVTAAAG